MKKQYDFSKGERGKFYRVNLELNVPIYLEPDVAKVIRERARKGRSSMGGVVNKYLRKSLRSSAKRAGLVRP